MITMIETAMSPIKQQNPNTLKMTISATSPFLSLCWFCSTWTSDSVTDEAGGTTASS